MTDPGSGSALFDLRPALLGRSEIHVWRAKLDAGEAAYQMLRAWLSDDELRRADSFRFDTLRHRYVIGHGRLREILGLYLGREPGSLRFSSGAFGKPSLASLHPSLEFNLAHSGGLALVAVSAQPPVGVDLELIATAHLRYEEVAPLAFTRQERAWLEARPEPSAWLSHWTRKEAYLKALGLGLYRSANEILIQNAGRFDRWRTASPGARPWWITDLDLGPTHVGAVATPEPDPVLRVRTWGDRADGAGDRPRPSSGV